MAETVKISTKEGYGDCEDCGGYDFADATFEFPNGLVTEHSYCNHMGPGLNCAIPNWGSPYNFRAFVQGYANALIDQGFEIEHIDLSEDP